HAADDVEAKPWFVVAVVRAFFTNGGRGFAGLEKHAHDCAVKRAALVANEKTALRLFCVVAHRLPKPCGRRLCAKRSTGCDKRQKSGGNRRISCSHFGFLRI